MTRLAASPRPRLPASWPGMLVVMLSSTIIGMTMAFTFPLLSLVLAREGVSSTLIGLNAAANGLAIFVIAPWLPGLVARLGAVRSIAYGLLLCMACLLLMPLKVDLWLWFGLRFMLGLGTVIGWVASESAINAIVPDRIRGRIMGFYATLFCVGYAAGPALVGLTGSEGMLPFLVAAAFLLLGIAPLPLAHGVDQAMAGPASSNLVQIWHLAPLALAAVLAFGLVETAGFALIPVYGLRLGFGEAGATLLLTALIAGNVVFQLPIGWLSDRADRSRVLLGCIAIGLVCCLLWPLLIDRPLIWPLLLLQGGVLGGLYTISLTLLGERFRGGDLAVANTAFALMYQLGATVGPAIGGTAMTALGPQGLPLTLAAALAVLLLAAGLAWRRAAASA